MDAAEIVERDMQAPKRRHCIRMLKCDRST
jgi:hypothetical protein